MNSKHHKKSRGFTLIEVMSTVFISVLMMGAMTEVLIVLTQQSGYRFSSLGSIDQVRSVGKQFVNEMRNAQTGSDGSFAISQASTTQVIFYTSFGGASSTTVRRIRYYLATSTLYKGVITPTGSPLTYNTGSEVKTPVVNNVLNGTSSVFTYYDGSYAGTSSALTQPVNLTQVAYVKMSLKLLQQDAKNSTTTYTFSVGGAIRSLKNNLGN